MKKIMNITGAVTYVNYDGRQASIPHGPCTVDYGPRPSELVVISWGQRELLFAIEMGLTELAGHVAGDRVGARNPAVPAAWTGKMVRSRQNAGKPVQPPVPK